MKKIKFMAMLLMATMAFGFTSCSDDDEEDSTPTPENLEANLEGKWFLVERTDWYEYNEEREETTEKWDINDPYEEGSEGDDPCILRIENYGNNRYSFSPSSYIFSVDGTYEISDDNVIYSYYYDEDDYVITTITKINSEELEIVTETEEDTGYGVLHSLETYKFRRIVDEE